MLSSSTFQSGSCGRVIALHCSGANAEQWRGLGTLLGSAFDLTSPEHYGGNCAGPWTGDHAFALADEAARTIALIDGDARRVHLVGHSYGGGVALHVALRRPQAIASLTLYEPSAFHILREIGTDGAKALDEIQRIAQVTGACIIRGDYRGAASHFVDYWGGKGAWDSLLRHQQLALTRWAPKAPLDFAALSEEPSSLSEYRALQIPSLVMHGEHALYPSRLIAETLSELLPDACLVSIPGAGHMGPLTHGPQVLALIASYVTATHLRSS